MKICSHNHKPQVFLYLYCSYVISYFRQREWTIVYACMCVFFALGMSTSSKSTKRMRDVAWEDVIFSISSSLTVDKGQLVKDLTQYSSPKFFLELSKDLQTTVCEKCGVEGWEETIVAAIMGVLSKVYTHAHTLYLSFVFRLACPHRRRHSGLMCTALSRSQINSRWLILQV